MKILRVVKLIETNLPENVKDHINSHYSDYVHIVDVTKRPAEALEENIIYDFMLEHNLDMISVI